MMDRQKLFNSSKNSHANPAHQKERFFGITDSLVYLPLVYGIKNGMVDHDFKTSIGSIAENANKLREGEIELGLISSLDYALKKETWHVIPDLCVSAIKSVKHVQLFFKKGSTDIQRVAVDRGASSEVTLLKILMREKYMMSPDYTEMDADLESMLSNAEAALIVGDKGIDYAQDNRNRLDLNEEWLDLTGLPFVYAFWAGREMTVTTDDLKAIKSSFELGEKNLENISKEYARNHRQNWSVYHDFYTQNMSYTFSDVEKDGLNEFYNYAFFYGFTEFIPDLYFYKI